MSYGDVHRRLLQSFAYHPVQSKAETLRVYKLVCQEQEREESDLAAIIQTINEELRRHTNLEIKTLLCELTGSEYYVAVNTTHLTWSKSTSPYSKNEQLLFKKLVDDIARSEDRNVSSIACLNHNIQSNMTKVDASKSIARFVKDGWFCEKEGCLYMGVRAIAELEPYVSEAHEDVKRYCPLCKMMMFWGHQCGSCSETSHIHCLRKFFASVDSDTACPSCRAEWTTDWDEDYDN